MAKTKKQVIEAASAVVKKNFDLGKFKKKKGSVSQTIVNHIDVIIHNNENNDLNLFVRRSFSEDLWLWINDSASFL